MPSQSSALIWRLLQMMSKNGLSARKAPKRVEMAVLTLRAFAQLSLAQRVLTIIMLLLSKETLAARENQKGLRNYPFKMRKPQLLLLNGETIPRHNRLLFLQRTKLMINKGNLSLNTHSIILKMKIRKSDISLKALVPKNSILLIKGYKKKSILLIL